MPAEQQPQRSGKSATAGQYRQTHYNNHYAMDQWLAWCEDNGVVAPALILFKWVRTNAPHKSFNNNSLGVMLKDDCIHVKNWPTGECFTFFDNKPFTAAQYREQQAEHKRLSAIAEAQQLADHQSAAQLAERLLHEAISAPVAGYFISKGLNSTHGAKWHQRLNCWLVAVTDIDGNIYTIQKIYNKLSKNKFYLKGGRTAGGMVILGSLTGAKNIIVLEGFATGCTLREETGETIVCALSSTNLIPVCTAIRAANPHTNIIVAGDDDHRKEINTGRLNAEEAARVIDGKVCFPTFCDGCTSCSDFNDAVACNKLQEVTK